jgi:hypothetical protein
MSHLDAIEAAMQADRALGRIFAEQLGTAANPDGAIVQAYERARLGLAGADGDATAVARVMSQLVDDVGATLATALDAGASVGAEQAVANLAAFGQPAGTTIRVDSLPFLRRLLGIVEEQRTVAVSGLLDTAELIGEGQRVGLISHGVVTRDASRWIATLATETFEQTVRGGAPDTEWERQAVAAIDENTTPCCLDVHGQIVGLDEPFETPQPPAFADEQTKPPFHEWCRTVVVLVPAGMGDDELTADMRLAARLEREARERPGYEPPELANAFTRVRD